MILRNSLRLTTSLSKGFSCLSDSSSRISDWKAGVDPAAQTGPDWEAPNDLEAGNDLARFKNSIECGFRRQRDFASHLADTFAEMILDRNTMYHRESVVDGLVAKLSVKNRATDARMKRYSELLSYTSSKQQAGRSEAGNPCADG